MAFEQRDRDILGRTGRITVKGKTVETPVFLPVVNPLIDTIPPRRLEEEFRCQALITNSYIVWKHMDRENPPDIHALLDFHGVVMTDSGAYQILVYGGVEVSQREIIEWQKAINSDIAVILDIPTGWGVDRGKVEATVEETLRRAREAVPLIRDSDALWVGPIQGGVYLDLVARSAREVGEMPYHIHALGSPTQVMERYNYPVLVDMAMTAKINAPRSRPLHLFGAGHPNILALSVAMGYDIFDSASYALFAKDDRYMTPRTTLQLGSLEHLPCTCPVCSKTDPQSLRELPKGERQRKLAEHNLHVILGEMRTIKQAIHEGSLWELVEQRSRGHPQLTSALKTLAKYRDHLEEGAPGFKGRGIFIYDHLSLARPEVTRFRRRLRQRVRLGSPTRVVFSSPTERPYTEASEFKEISAEEALEGVDVVFVDAPLGAVPLPLAYTYPATQHMISTPLDHETIVEAVEAATQYLAETPATTLVLHWNTPLDQALLTKLGEPPNLDLNQHTPQEAAAWIKAHKQIRYNNRELKE